MQFFHEVRLELSKVIWPNYNEFVGSTIVVLILMSAFALYLGAVDGVLLRLVTYVYKSYGMF